MTKQEGVMKQPSVSTNLLQLCKPFAFKNRSFFKKEEA